LLISNQVKAFGIPARNGKHKWSSRYLSEPAGEHGDGPGDEEADVEAGGAGVQLVHPVSILHPQAEYLHTTPHFLLISSKIFLN